MRRLAQHRIYPDSTSAGARLIMDPVQLVSIQSQCSVRLQRADKAALARLSRLPDVGLFSKLGGLVVEYGPVENNVAGASEILL